MDEDEQVRRVALEATSCNEAPKRVDSPVWGRMFDFSRYVSLSIPKSSQLPNHGRSCARGAVDESAF